MYCFLVNKAKFDKAEKYLKNSNRKEFLIKLYFTRRNEKKNIIENTSSSTIKLSDSILTFNKDEQIV